MVPANAGAAAGAAAAAAAAAELARREEEEMTSYDARDLAEDWEFKILRSTTGIFGKRERLREVLEDEGRAGWVLVEKFDNQRIRLKRPVAARANDEYLDFDPYRTNTGITDAKLAVIILASVVCAIAFVGILVAVAVN